MIKVGKVCSLQKFN